jgi:hypothetical protein
MVLRRRDVSHYAMKEYCSDGDDIPELVTHEEAEQLEKFVQRYAIVWPFATRFLDLTLD